MSRYSKAIAALLGALTPTVVVAVLAAFGVHVNAGLAALVCTVVSGLATMLAPANTTTSVTPVVPPQATPPLH